MRSFTHAIVFGHIIVLAASFWPSARIATYMMSQLQSMSNDNQREDKRAQNIHHWGEFLHNYYMFESVHDGNHNGIVRIFVGFEVSLIFYITVSLITLHD